MFSLRAEFEIIDVAEGHESVTVRRPGLLDCLQPRTPSAKATHTNRKNTKKYDSGYTQVLEDAYCCLARVGRHLCASRYRLRKQESASRRVLANVTSLSCWLVLQDRETFPVSLHSCVRRPRSRPVAETPRGAINSRLTSPPTTLCVDNSFMNVQSSTHHEYCWSVDIHAKFANSANWWYDSRCTSCGSCMVSRGN